MRGLEMFNIYYINYEKAYQIAMLLDNKVIEQRQKEKGNQVEGNGTVSTDFNGLEGIPFLGKYMPKLDMEGEITGVKTNKVIDTVKVISTKSTILDRIYSKTKEVKKLQEKTVGSLVRIKDVKLSIMNAEEIIGVKTLISGAIGRIPVEGVGDIDFTSFLSVFLKDASYVLEGILPVERFDNNEKIMIKIPMAAENELENQYSLSDLEIGKVTLIGIYRGQFEQKELEKLVNRFSGKRTTTNKKELDTIIECDDSLIESEGCGDIKIHYLDIIAVVQDITF